MKPWAFVIVLLSLCSGTRAYAQTEPNDLQRCVRQFYDPKEYNWLLFENTCSVPIVVHSGYGVLAQPGIAQAGGHTGARALSTPTDLRPLTVLSPGTTEPGHYSARRFDTNCH